VTVPIGAGHGSLGSRHDRVHAVLFPISHATPHAVRVPDPLSYIRRPLKLLRFSCGSERRRSSNPVHRIQQTGKEESQYEPEHELSVGHARHGASTIGVDDWCNSLLSSLSDAGGAAMHRKTYDRSPSDKAHDEAACCRARKTAGAATTFPVNVVNVEGRKRYLCISQPEPARGFS